MPSPFPGMDPYIERPALWPDFHHTMVVYMRSALQPVLRPRYAALIRQRRFLVRYGDSEEEERQSFVTIFEPPDVTRILTVVELLTVENKAPGPARESYLEARGKALADNINVVEIDLLHEGEATVWIAPENRGYLRPSHYLVAATWAPASSGNQAFCAFSVRDALPAIRIPLAHRESVELALSAAFTRCWDGGPYPELLRYEGPPPGKWAADDITWCGQRLRRAGFRPLTQSLS